MTDEEIVTRIVRDVFGPMRDKMRRPMDDTEVKMMINMHSMPRAKAAEMFSEMANKLVAANVASNRARDFRLDIDERVLVFIALVSRSPGDIVLYVSFLAWCAREARMPSISFDTFVTNVCPMGFCTDEDLTILWDASKYREEGIGYLNGLDSEAVINFLNSPKGGGL